jgi:ribosomal protein L44E
VKRLLLLALAGLLCGTALADLPALRLLREPVAWYTPFAHPGLPAPYDWQGLHRPAGAGRAAPTDQLRATYSPLHFRPAAELASDAECLACHREVLDDRVRARSPSGLAAQERLAAYQRVSTYAGPQETFHRRHLVTPLARQLMDLRCNTCHAGHDPREEAPGGSADGPPAGDAAFTLRKQVNPETTCLKCHGQMNWQAMGLAGPWPEVRKTMGDTCLTCHAAIRTNRHRVSYLKAAAIEAAGKAGSESCFGCHGGRAWYRIPYPYPRHPWPNMPAETPDWAKGRPAHAEPRFALPVETINR